MKSLRLYLYGLLSLGIAVIVLVSNWVSAEPADLTHPSERKAALVTLAAKREPTLRFRPPTADPADPEAASPEATFSETTPAIALDEGETVPLEASEPVIEVSVTHFENSLWNDQNRPSRRRPAIVADDRSILAVADNRNGVRARSDNRTAGSEATPFRTGQWADPVEAVPIDVTALGILCKDFVAQAQEFAPVQLVDVGTPSGSEQLVWVSPAEATYQAPFSGSQGLPAGHEGIDYVNIDPNMAEVPVVTAAEGRVMYVRSGCPQSIAIGVNRELRECGAGWGNHVVVDHGGGLLTRYAHLAPESVTVQVGKSVWAGERLGLMGNTGRSDTRHLHFEVGFAAQSLDACAPAQSFEVVYNPASLGV